LLLNQDNGPDNHAKRTLSSNKLTFHTIGRTNSSVRLSTLAGTWVQFSELIAAISSGKAFSMRPTPADSPFFCYPRELLPNISLRNTNPALILLNFHNSAITLGKMTTHL
jgi:hypothetical protein